MSRFTPPTRDVRKIGFSPICSEEMEANFETHAAFSYDVICMFNQADFVQNTYVDAKHTAIPLFIGECAVES